MRGVSGTDAPLLHSQQGVELREGGRRVVDDGSGDSHTPTPNTAAQVLGSISATLNGAADTFSRSPTHALARLPADVQQPPPCPFLSTHQTQAIRVFSLRLSVALALAHTSPPPPLLSTSRHTSPPPNTRSRCSHILRLPLSLSLSLRVISATLPSLCFPFQF